MSRLERQVDKDGFVIPAKLTDLPGQNVRDEQNFGSSGKPQLSAGALRWKRRIIVLAILGCFVGLICTIFYKPLREFYFEARIQMGHQAYETGHYRNACWHFNAVLSDELEQPQDEWSLQQQNILLNVRLERALARIKLEEYDAAMADLNLLCDGVANQELRAIALTHRAFLHYRFKQPEQALADMERAVTDQPNSDSQLNSRAYLYALTNTNLKQGLTDIDQAIVNHGRPSPEFLDTRAYLLYKLGRHQDALVDINQSIQLTEQQRRSWEAELQRKPGRKNRHLPRDQIENMLSSIRETLAVIYFHRNEIYRALDKTEQADEDLRQAREYGYDEARNMF